MSGMRTRGFGPYFEIPLEVVSHSLTRKHSRSCPTPRISQRHTHPTYMRDCAPSLRGYLGISFFEYRFRSSKDSLAGLQADRSLLWAESEPNGNGSENLGFYLQTGGVLRELGEAPVCGPFTR